MSGNLERRWRIRNTLTGLFLPGTKRGEAWLTFYSRTSAEEWRLRQDYPADFEIVEEQR